MNEKIDLSALPSSTETPPPYDVRVVLIELLRLYDWRFFLAEREKDPRQKDKEFATETRRLLNKYGIEKKAAWEAARRAIAGS